MLETSRQKSPAQASIQKWQEVFKELGAEWEYRGGDVCALYTLSGKVSDYYFNSEVISEKPEVLRALCEEIFLPELRRRSIDVDVVASYPPYGVSFADTLAKALGVRSCLLRSIGTAELDQDIKEGSRVLVVADDIFSGGSVRRTMQAALAKRCTLVPAVLAFGNFSGGPSIDGVEIFAVINRKVELFDLADSPLVAKGVRPVNARQHWHECFAPKKGESV